MGETPRDSRNQTVTERYVIMLLSILLTMLLRPFLSPYFTFPHFLEFFMTSIIFCVTFTIEAPRLLRRSLAVLAGAVVLAAVLAAALASRGLTAASQAAFSLFFVAALVTLLFDIYHQPRVSAHMIVGVVCGYLLMGLAWGSTFSFLETLAPGSFNLDGSAQPVASQLLYFSFVTLATLGYGDITPATDGARSLAVLEALLGQLYLAILMAGLVGVYISSTLRAKREPDGSRRGGK
ncbi:MAG: ion channel [Acidobacteriota bacterium]